MTHLLYYIILMRKWLFGHCANLLQSGSEKNDSYLTMLLCLNHRDVLASLLLSTDFFLILFFKSILFC